MLDIKRNPSANPAISIILPVYNGEAYIKQAVASILNQTFSDFELIIMNNASTDSTIDILRSFNDPRIKIITNEQTYKVSKSLNIGINAATGTYVARMDGDDIAHPKRFEEQMACFNANPEIGFCATWVEEFGGDNKTRRNYIHHSEIKANLLFLNTIYHPTIMFKKEEFDKYGLRYNESLKLVEDYTLWVHSIERVKFANVPQVLLKYRIHNNNVSVMKGNNRDILDEGHYLVYSHIFDKLKLNYSQDDMLLHRKIALREINYKQPAQVSEAIQWLQKIVTANKKTLYYEEKALSKIILSCLTYMLYKSKGSLKAVAVVAKAIFELYPVGIIASFMKERMWRESKSVNKIDELSYL